MTASIPSRFRACEDLLAAGLAEMCGEESPVSDDDSEGGCLFHRSSPLSSAVRGLHDVPLTMGYGISSEVYVAVLLYCTL